MMVTMGATTQEYYSLIQHYDRVRVSSPDVVVWELGKQAEYVGSRYGALSSLF